MKEPLRSKGLRMLELFAIVSTFLFLVFFGQIFFNYMMRIWHTTQTSPTMHIPMGLVYLPVFVGIVLCAFHEIYLLAVWFSKGRSASAVAE
jgi:TRAP-type C4-dicarboxylate transport system permease small subunit